MSIGGALKRAWFKQSDLAREVNVSIHTVRAWILDRRSPDAAMAKKIAKAFREHAQRMIRAAEELERRSQ